MVPVREELDVAVEVPALLELDLGDGGLAQLSLMRNDQEGRGREDRVLGSSREARVKVDAGGPEGLGTDTPSPRGRPGDRRGGLRRSEETGRDRDPEREVATQVEVLETEIPVDVLERHVVVDDVLVSHEEVTEVPAVREGTVGMALEPLEGIAEVLNAA